MSAVMTAPTHIPVLLTEAVEALAVQPGGRYIDCTLGAGGHAAAILDRSSPGGQLLGFDADPEALKAAEARLAAYGDSALLFNENFANLEAICVKYDFAPVHGILFDLGMSSLQLNGTGRGFSFQHDAPLDMRFDPSQEVTAADIVNTYSEADLARLIKTYGEETRSRRIAQHIVQQRPIETTLQLAWTIEHATGGRRGRIHPATKTFQALRIAVNYELEYLETALKQATNLLGFEGRLVVISYHSLEDRIVKQFMKQESSEDNPRLRRINKKVIIPSDAEIHMNSRSRSAKLRAAERITNQHEQYIVSDKYSSSEEIGAMGWRRPGLLKKIRRTFATL